MLGIATLTIIAFMTERTPPLRRATNPPVVSSRSPGRASLLIAVMCRLDQNCPLKIGGVLQLDQRANYPGISSTTLRHVEPHAREGERRAGCVPAQPARAIGTGASGVADDATTPDAGFATRGGRPDRRCRSDLVHM